MVFYLLAEDLKEKKNSVENVQGDVKRCSAEFDVLNEEMKELIKKRGEQRKQLGIIDGQIKELTLRRTKAKNDLKKVRLKLKKLTEILESAKLIEAINVGNDGKYLLRNGLVDLKRDLLMKLLKVVGDKGKIRNIIGISRVFFTWSKQRTFKWARRGYMSDALNEKKKHFYTLVRTPEGIRCTFGDKNETVFLKQCLSSGTFHWQVLIKYGEEKDAEEGNMLLFGTADPSSLPKFDSKTFGNVDIHGVYSIQISKYINTTIFGRGIGFVDPGDSSNDDDDDNDNVSSSKGAGSNGGGGGSSSSSSSSSGSSSVFDEEKVSDMKYSAHEVYESALNGVGGTLDDEFCYISTRVPDNAVLGLEVDVDRRQLSFFVNGEKVPEVISHIKTPVHFGASGSLNSSFTSISLRRLPCATPSSVPCVVLKAKGHKDRYKFGGGF